MIEKIGGTPCRPGDSNIIQVRRIINDGKGNENNLDFCVDLTKLGEVYGWRRKVRMMIANSNIQSSKPENGPTPSSRIHPDGAQGELPM